MANCMFIVIDLIAKHYKIGLLVVKGCTIFIMSLRRYAINIKLVLGLLCYETVFSSYLKSDMDSMSSI